MTETTHARIINALTEYDRKQSTRKGYNPYTMGHYCRALGETREVMAEGATIEEALTANFCGRLLDIVLKAIR